MGTTDKRIKLFTNLVHGVLLAYPHHQGMRMMILYTSS